jgi:hypothetical protein
MFLSGKETARFSLPKTAAWIEVRGARGQLGIRSIGPAALEFRSALAAGRSIGAAATEALEQDAAFDAGLALRELVAAGLVAGIRPATKGENP